MELRRTAAYSRFWAAGASMERLIQRLLLHCGAAPCLTRLPASMNQKRKPSCSWAIRKIHCAYFSLRSHTSEVPIPTTPGIGRVTHCDKPFIWSPSFNHAQRILQTRIRNRRRMVNPCFTQTSGAGLIPFVASISPRRTDCPTKDERLFSVDSLTLQAFDSNKRLRYSPGRMA